MIGMTIDQLLSAIRSSGHHISQAELEPWLEQMVVEGMAVRDGDYYRGTRKLVDIKLGWAP